MSVAAYVANPDEARTVMYWAGRFAAARGTDLIIFYTPVVTDSSEVRIAVDGGAEEISDHTRRAIEAATEDIVRTRRARKGRIARHDVSVRRVPEPERTSATLARLRIESPELFVCAAPGPGARNGSYTTQIAAKCSCHSVVLHSASDRAIKTKSIVVGTSEGGHDLDMLELASRTAEASGCVVTALCIEAAVGDQAVEVGERHLRGLLRDLSLQESPRLVLKALAADDRTRAVAEESRDADLLMVGANMAGKVPALLEASPGTMVGVFKQGPRFELSRNKVRVPSPLPRLNPTDYANLFEQLQSGSRWNSDFIVMLSLAAAIATLGLLQNSPAVVIGSMLLAPLMTPMIGMGLALNQGNSKLAYACFRSINRGFATTLAISFLLGWVTPGTDLTPEVAARTEPNILDLLVALLSGFAAAYALARPSVAGSIAGVAIATAIVPPLCSFGLCLAYGRYALAVGAISLLLANVLAIILAAAATFGGMGLKAFSKDAPRRFWVRNVVIGLFICVVLVSIPLVNRFLEQVPMGKTSPIAFAVTDDVRELIRQQVDAMPGVELIFLGQSGTHRENNPADFGIILSAAKPLPRSVGDKLTGLLQESLDRPDLKVRVECVSAGWRDTPAEQ